MNELHDKIDFMTDEELFALTSRLRETMEARQQEGKRETMQKIRELAAQIGVAVELTPIKPGERVNSRVGTKVPAKYRNPENPIQKWSGRGLPPKWMSGRNREDFLIN